jgi:hypothetical protein
MKNTTIADVVAAAVEIYGNTADAVVAVADAANSAGVSAEDLSKATGISIEGINKAAAEANVAITNQETAAASGTGDGDNEEGDDEGGRYYRLSRRLGQNRRRVWKLCLPRRFSPRMTAGSAKKTLIY